MLENELSGGRFSKCLLGWGGGVQALAVGLRPPGGVETFAVLAGPASGREPEVRWRIRVENRKLALTAQALPFLTTFMAAEEVSRSVHIAEGKVRL